MKIIFFQVFLWAYFIYAVLTILVIYTLQARIQNFIASAKRIKILRLKLLHVTQKSVFYIYFRF